MISRHSSNSKASYEDSLSGFSNGSRKVGLKSPALRNIVEMAKKKNSVMINSEAQIVGAISSEAGTNNNNSADTRGRPGLLARLSSKLSRAEVPEPPREGDNVAKNAEAN